MQESTRTATAVLASGLAGGIATVDLAGIGPSTPALVTPLIIAVVALVGVTAGGRVWPPEGRGRRALWAFGAWLAWSIVSGIVSDHPVLAVTTSLAFALTMAGAIGVAQIAGRKGLVTMVAVAVTVHAVVAVGFAFFVDHDQFRPRLSLVELEANHLGQLLAVVVLVSALWALDQPAVRWIPPLMWAGVAVLGLILTGSRTAPTALVVAGLVALVAERRWRLLIGVSMALLVGVGALMVTGADSRLVSLTNRSSSELTTLNGGNGRVTLWRSIDDVIDERPIVGVGLGNDRERVLEMNAAVGFDWNPQHAHNLVLHLALTTGWVGAALFVGGLVTALGVGLIERQPWLAAIVAFILVDGVAEPVLRLPQPTWALLIGSVTLGLIGPGPSSAATTSLVRNPTRSPLPFAPVLVGSGSALLVAIGLVWFQPGGYPQRFRCRSEVPFEASGLIVDIDGTAGSVRMPAGEATLGNGTVSGADGIMFEAGDRGVMLPEGTARTVRCAGMRQDSVTVVVDVATADVATEGPGRILTISSGPGWSDIDLQLGQEADALSLRVRANAYWRNDQQVPDIFTDTEMHQLIVIIEPLRIRVWRDGVLMSSELVREPTHFEEWEVGRAAVLGNEVTQDRPFVGTIGSVQIFQGVRDPIEPDDG